MIHSEKTTYAWRESGKGERRLEQGTGGMELRIRGNRCAVADGCDGIVDYGEEQVTLRSGRLTVRIVGKKLCLKRLTANSAVVEGMIGQVDYLYGKRGGEEGS